jgi:hypothetical protein
VHAAGRPAGAHPGRRRGLEGGQARASGLDVARLRQQAGAARERLDPRRLRHSADPGRRAAAEVEGVLPGDEIARAAHGELGHLVEQSAEARLVAAGLPALAGAMHVVGLLEGGQRVQLQALAREVLVEDLAALEADLVADARVRQRAPVAAVALELHERRRHARHAEPPRQRERLD